MKKAILIMIIITVSLSMFYFLKRKNSSNGKKYQMITVSYENIQEYIETTGQAEPLNRVEILPPSSGRIEKIMVEEGENVNSGDILALMSSQDRVAILDAARAIGDKEYNYWQDAYKPIKILAPLKGRIILRNIVEGQTVSASTVLFAMSDILIIVASVDESDIGKVKLNQRAYIRFDAYPEREISGKVFQILDEGKNSNNVIIYKVKIRLDFIPDFLKSQMTANIKIRVAKNKKAIVIPTSAINYSREGNTYVITGFDRKKNPIEKNIETGNEYNGKTEIKSGLKEGENIYMELKDYITQKKDSTVSPFMPKRPAQETRRAMKAMRGN